jgi:hypothetical protein
MRLNEDLDREYNLEIEKEYVQLLKDVFDTVPRVIDGKLLVIYRFCAPRRLLRGLHEGHPGAGHLGREGI